MLLKDKVIVVSGVGPGLGQALARMAVAAGARVVMAARNSDYLRSLQAEIGAENTVVAPCDVTDAAQCRAVAQAGAELTGRIDGLINSAFFHGEWSFVENTTSSDMAQAFDVCCTGALRMAQACLPFMKGDGAIVNVSTMATLKPYGAEGGMELSYAAGKGALNTLGKYMAADLGRYGIRVNTCRMGWIHGAPVERYIQSEIDAGRSRSEVVSQITADIPIGTIPPEDDCARGVLMLLSDHARAITGASLDINGGHWMAP